MPREIDHAKDREIGNEEGSRHAHDGRKELLGKLRSMARKAAFVPLVAAVLAIPARAQTGVDFAVDMNTQLDSPAGNFMSNGSTFGGKVAGRIATFEGEFVREAGTKSTYIYTSNSPWGYVGGSVRYKPEQKKWMEDSLSFSSGAYYWHFNPNEAVRPTDIFSLGFNLQYAGQIGAVQGGLFLSYRAKTTAFIEASESIVIGDGNMKFGITPTVGGTLAGVFNTPGNKNVNLLAKLDIWISTSDPSFQITIRTAYTGGSQIEQRIILSYEPAL